ncbi:MAG TPA: HEPN domain-containing protein [Thermomicrobiales bacterium]|nr:HEPN domain-containing protein [Thermomicrobiales bacterium]
MADESDLYLSKAVESLAGAESEFANGRYNNAANRAYYACFQAAITALNRAGIHPSGARGEWGHDFVQSQFAGQLINRRKAYPAELRDTLLQSMRVRAQADYKITGVSEAQASRALARARTFVAPVVAYERGGTGR